MNLEELKKMNKDLISSNEILKDMVEYWHRKFEEANESCRHAWAIAEKYSVELKGIKAASTEVVKP